MNNQANLPQKTAAHFLLSSQFFGFSGSSGPVHFTTFGSSILTVGVF